MKSRSDDSSVPTSPDNMGKRRSLVESINGRPVLTATVDPVTHEWQAIQVSEAGVRADRQRCKVNNTVDDAWDKRTARGPSRDDLSTPGRG
jgi:hypothetical protein